MISAIESNRFIFTFSQENGKLNVMDPIKRENQNVLVFDLINLEGTKKNIYYATIELDYTIPDKSQKQLVIYEIYSQTGQLQTFNFKVNQSAHKLLRVPGFPGSVLILTQDHLIYRGVDGFILNTNYPLRAGNQGTMIVSYTINFNQKQLPEYILQNEFGDLLILNLEIQDQKIQQLKLKYLDTIPLSVSLCLSQSGTLFAPCERGDHNYYAIISLEQTSSQIIIKPKIVQNLKLVQTFPNFSCITDLQVKNLFEEEGNEVQDKESKQLFMLCAAGERSSLRILRHGLLVDEIVSQKFKFQPLGVWVLKKGYYDLYHRYIILSKQQQTVVLEVSTILREVFNSGIELDVQTIHISLLEDNSILQVKPQGFNVIKQNRQNFNFEGKIVKVSSNQCQLAIGFTGGTINYFELHQKELSQVGKALEKNHEICALEIGPIIEIGKMSTFLAVGLSDRSIQVISLSNENRFGILQTISQLSGAADSFCMMEMPIFQEEIEKNQLFLFVGLNDGKIMQITMNKINGKFVDTRKKKIGNSSVKCIKFSANGKPALLALSNRTWICYIQHCQLQIQPICYEQLSFALELNLEGAEESILGITNGLKKESDQNFKIISVQKYGELFNQRIFNLLYSPRKMIFINNTIAIIESDQNICREYVTNFKIEEEQIEGIDLNENKWCSCLTLFEFGPEIELLSRKTFDLGKNVHAISLCYYKSPDTNIEYILVGTVKNLSNYPERKFSKASITTFQFEKNEVYQLYHTQLDEMPYCIKSWKNRIIAGVGNYLMLYEFGKENLTKITQLAITKSFINNIQIGQDRLFIAESADVVHVIDYDEQKKAFFEIARDFMPRFMTACALLDNYTIVGADKFENVFVSQVPLDIDENLIEDQTQIKFNMDAGQFNTIPAQMKQLCNYQVGEVVTSLNKTQIESTGNQIIAYATSLGSIGVFYPIESNEDLDFYLRLEMFMRSQYQSISGQDHFKFRSFSGASYGVIDGDLCEQFSSLPSDQQIELAQQFKGDKNSIVRKLYDIKNKIL